MAQHEEMRNTVFGEVLAELLEKRGLEVTPFAVGKLGEQSGLDGWKLINRMANADAEDTGHLGGLANAMDLSEPEKVQLACAYTFERRAGEVRA
jgi:arginyl-tRNA synthetase